jgi:excisionase family DNA binding protein
MDLITVEEIAVRLKIKRSWVYSHADELGAYRLGKYLRFSWPRVIERLDQMSRPLDESPRDPLQQIVFTGRETDRK